jgi:hypothetical protein
VFEPVEYELVRYAVAIVVGVIHTLNDTDLGSVSLSNAVYDGLYTSGSLQESMPISIVSPTCKASPNPERNGGTSCRLKLPRLDPSQRIVFGLASTLGDFNHSRASLYVPCSPKHLMCLYPSAGFVSEGMCILIVWRH